MSPPPHRCIVNAIDMTRMGMSAIYQVLSEGATDTGVIQTYIVTP